MDINTRMYIGSGTSLKSEKEAFLQAIKMVNKTGITIQSLRLDRYFSAQAYVKLCVHNFGDVKMYLIPKINATIKGTQKWKRMLKQFVEDTKEYLREYYKRNQSESGFSEDKKRTGWRLGQKREDRIDTADFLTTIWHNRYWLG
jgi:transposase